MDQTNCDEKRKKEIAHACLLLQTSWFTYGESHHQCPSVWASHKRQIQYICYKYTYA